MGPYKPLRNWVDEFIPYYMEIMGVDRPDRTYKDPYQQLRRHDCPALFRFVLLNAHAFSVSPVGDELMWRLLGGSSQDVSG